MTFQAEVKDDVRRIHDRHDSLKKVARRREKVPLAVKALAESMREAVENGCRKVDVAKAAGVSRPTLDKILNERKSA